MYKNKRRELTFSYKNCIVERPVATMQQQLVHLQRSSVNYTFSAVDKPEARLREDAFHLTTKPKKGVCHLTVAVVLPPKKVTFDKEKFLANLKEGNIYTKGRTFIEGSKDSIVQGSLQENDLREVLCAHYRLKPNREILVERLSIEKITIKPCTYEEFEGLKKFPKIELHIKRILETDGYTWEHYKSKRLSLSLSQFPKNFSRSESLIEGMMNMFNRTCSYYSQKQNIPTVSTYSGSTHLNPRRYARFSAPLRKAESFINIQNLYAHLLEGELPFSEPSLRSLGIELQTA
jgi:hypothetical protein